MKTCVNETAEEVIGKRRGTRKEQWITQDTWKLIDVRKEAKCKASQSGQENKEELNQKYANLEKKVKKSCKKDKKAFIKKKETEAEQAAKKNDSKTLFKIVKELTGVNSNNKVPKQGKLLNSSEEQNQRWIEHFREVLNQLDPP